MVRVITRFVLTCFFALGLGHGAENENCLIKNGVDTLLTKMIQKECTLDEVVWTVDRLESLYSNSWEDDLEQFIENRGELLKKAGAAVKTLFPHCFCYLELSAITANPKLYENMFHFLATFKISLNNSDEKEALKCLLNYYNLGNFYKLPETKADMNKLIKKHNLKKLDSLTEMPLGEAAYMTVLHILPAKMYYYKGYLTLMAGSIMAYNYFI